MVLTIMFGGIYVFEQERQALVDRIHAETKAQGCTSAEQSYYMPTIFYLHCPDGIRELDLSLDLRGEQNKLK